LQPAWELPEMASNQHIIFIPTTQKPASVEVCLEGRVQAVDFGLDEYAQGCFGILPANLPFKMGWNVEVEFFHFYLEPVMLSQIAHESVNPDQVKLLLDVKRFDSLISQIALALRADLEGDGMGNGFYADSLATAMSAHLIQHYSTRKPIFREYGDGLSKQKLQRAIDYINAGLDGKPLLAAIAADLDMSQYYFCRLFKQSTGMTPHQYLMQQRVERSKQLLQQTELTITEVAMECGFTHQSHFAKYFRRYTGFTPRQFRQR
jgi:AraC family transcriptional regulator